jgi:type IV pilus assembly protein PilM
MAQVSLGLDIGSYSIKVAQLAKQRDNFVISGLGYTLIKDSGSANLAPAIKEALRQLKVATRKVNATIFSQGAVVRYVSLPLMGQKELTQAMDFEMERYVPFKPSDAFADYQILKEDPVTRNMKVLMVAAI